MEAIKKIAETFLYTNKNTDSVKTETRTTTVEPEIKSPTIRTPVFANAGNFPQFFENDNNIASDRERKEHFKKDINKEVEQLVSMLQANNSKLIREIKITREFWFDNNKKFPYLSKLALRLSNISSSSAFIERYFSICGFVQNVRNQNMSQDLFIKRCFLRANIKILNEIAGSLKKLQD